MKHKTLLLLPLALFLSLIASNNLIAQTDSLHSKTDDRADRMTQMLNKNLDFTADQYTQVHDIISNYISTHTQGNFDRKELNDQIEQVLTPDQKVKFEELQAKRKPRPKD